MLCSVLIRRLKPGATYDDFREAWKPNQGFGVPVRVINAQSLDDPNEIVSVGLVDLPTEDLPAMLKTVAESEARRHEQIAHVIEETVHKGIYEIVDDDDLS
ncbi:MAG: hypothetical protein AAF563_21865 [Pseudomonadota bacterium]